MYNLILTYNYSLKKIQEKKKKAKVLKEKETEERLAKLDMKRKHDLQFIVWFL